MTQKTVEVAIADIVKRKELMPRRGVSDAVVTDYKASLELLPPILLGVDKDEDGNEVLILLDGWHRLTAFEEEGHETIKAVIDKKIKPEEFYATAAKANKAHGRRLTAQEKRTVARTLYTEYGVEDTEYIADAIGCSERHARRLVESFQEAKRNLLEKKVIKLSKKKNPDTDKEYTLREIAEMDDIPLSKSTVGRIIKKAERKKKELPESDDDVEEIDYDSIAEEDEDIDDDDDYGLPDQDQFDSSNIVDSVKALMPQIVKLRKAIASKKLTKETMDAIELPLEVLKKELDNALEAIVDVTL